MCKGYREYSRDLIALYVTRVHRAGVSLHEALHKALHTEALHDTLREALHEALRRLCTDSTEALHELYGGSARTSARSPARTSTRTSARTSARSFAYRRSA